LTIAKRIRRRCRQIIVGRKNGTHVTRCMLHKKTRGKGGDRKLFFFYPLQKLFDDPAGAAAAANKNSAKELKEKDPTFFLFFFSSIVWILTKGLGATHLLLWVEEGAVVTQKRRSS
jgi:hypothetical protein